MKAWTSLIVAAGLLAGSSMVAFAQDTSAARDQGPSAKKESQKVSGEITSIDSATKTIEVRSNDVPGQTGATTLQYMAKDEGALKKFKVGDQVTGKVDPSQTPPKLTDLKKEKSKSDKMDNNPSGMPSSTGRDTTSGGIGGAPPSTPSNPPSTGGMPGSPTPAPR